MTSIGDTLTGWWGSIKSWILGESGTVQDAVAANSGSIDTLAICLAVGFAAIAVLCLIGTLGQKLRWWHVAAGAVLGLLLTVLVQHYTGLIDWIELGVGMTSVPATLFLVGMAAMTVVMGYNLLITQGKTLVR